MRRGLPAGAAAAATWVVAAGCQVLAGIDERALGVVDEAGVDGAVDAGPDATVDGGHDSGLDGTIAADSDGVDADAAPTDASDSGSMPTETGPPVSYTAAVLADSPIAYWRLEESGQQPPMPAADSSGHGNSGEYVGEVAYGQPGAIQSDPTDKCIGLNLPSDGTGYVSVDQMHSTALQFSADGGRAPFTLEAWIEPTTVDGEYRGIVSNQTVADAGKEGFGFYVGGFTSNGMGIGFERYQDGTSLPVQDATAVTQNSGWYYVATTYDGFTTLLYVNGQVVGSHTSSIEIPPFTCTFDIGALRCGGSEVDFRGYIDEVAVYGTALSEQRIAAHYAAAH